MAFPFLKKPETYIKKELIARLNPLQNSRLISWIKVTSNLSDSNYPNGYSISSEGYTEVFGNYGYIESDAQQGQPNYKPNPIVTGFSVEFSDRGVSRLGTIKFKCHSIQQLEKLQKFFLEPGITIFVQWGWNKSSLSGQNIVPLAVDAATQKLFYRETVNLNKNRESNNGCYDNFLGVIINGKTSIQDDIFTLESKICAVGEAMMGLTSGDPAQEKKEDSEPQIYTESWLRDARNVSSPLNGGSSSSTYAGMGVYVPNVNNGKKHLIHWGLFWNSLPDSIRSITELQGWGENNSKINSAVSFINYDEKTLEDAKEDTTDGWFDNFDFLGKTIDPYDSTSPISEKKYVKFSVIIEMLNKILEIKKKLNPSLLGIDISQSYCGAFRQIFSIHPNCFIPNKNSLNFFNKNGFFLAMEPKGKSEKFPVEFDNSVKGFDNTTITFPMDKAVSIDWEGKKYTFSKQFGHGWIGDLYVEHDLAIECINSSLNTPIKDCLDKLMVEIEKSTDDFWDFQVFDHPASPNNNDIRITIMDANLINDGVSSSNKNTSLEIENFDLYGQNCVFKNFDFTFDIPKGLGTNIFMKKSTVGEAENLNLQTGVNTSPRGLFSDATDRIFNNFFPAKTVTQTLASVATIKSDDDEDKKANWIGFRNTSRLLLSPARSTTTGKVRSLSEDIIPGIAHNKEVLNSLRQKALKAVEKSDNASENKIASGTPLSIMISFTVLGISGFKVGDLLKINNLPKQYTDTTKGAFMVLKLSHSVEKEGWFTTIEAAYRPTYVSG